MPRRCWARRLRDSSWSSRSRGGEPLPADSPLATEIEKWLRPGRPGGHPGPDGDGRFSDSHWFREAFDSAVVYGSLPSAQDGAAGGDTARSRREAGGGGRHDLAARFYLDIVQAVLLDEPFGKWRLLPIPLNDGGR